MSPRKNGIVFLSVVLVWEVVSVMWIWRIKCLSFEISYVSKLASWTFRRDTMAFSTNLLENLLMTVKHILLQF